MRPQQQNRRMRGRNSGSGNNNNQNRKGPNPLTRNYESNGPDVKIRGSAQQIADKYTQLARDAQSSGDRVIAENYLQHAEHYNRIIAAAQAQMPIQNVQNHRDTSDDDEDEMEGANNPAENNVVQGNAVQANSQASVQASVQASAEVTTQDSGVQHPAGANGEQRANPASAPQPVIEGVPAEVALNPEATGEENAGGTQDSANPDAQERDGRRTRRPRRGERGRAAGKQGDDAPTADEGLAATLSRGSRSSAATKAKAKEKEAAAVPQAGEATLAEADS